MKHIVYIIFFCIGCFISMPHFAAAEFEKVKVAVIDFQQQGSGFESSDMGKIVSEWLITAMVKEGRFDVIERRLLEKIINEQKLAMEGIVDAKSAAQIGKLLGVKVIISGSVMKFHNVMEVNARIIDVKNASIIAAESVKSSTAVRLEDLVIQMAERIIKDFPLEGYVVSLNKNDVVIDLGRRTGVKKGMRFMVYKEGNVIKHPKTGEILDIQKIQTGIIEITSVADKIAHASVIEATQGNSISYGQQVKSIAKHYSKTSAKNLEPQPVVRKPGVVKRPDDATLETKYINMLRSENVQQKRAAARQIVRTRFFRPAVLDVVNDELLRGYAQSRGSLEIDMLAWLCNVLGASQNSKYKSTLETVAGAKVHRKLRKYARKNLHKLK